MKPRNVYTKCAKQAAEQEQDKDMNIMIKVTVTFGRMLLLASFPRMSRRERTPSSCGVSR
jgi:hypothetical protein